MKTLPLFVMVASLAEASAAERIALIDSEVQVGNTVEYREQHFADVESLAKLNDWKPFDGKPAPVTRDQALALAMNAARSSGRTEFKETETVVELLDTELFDEDTGEKIRLPRGTCLWFYKITFDRTNRTPESNYVVPMDGKVAVRIITR